MNHSRYTVSIPPAGIEPAAHGLGNRCSIQLSYGGINHACFQPGTPLKAVQTSESSYNTHSLIASASYSESKDIKHGSYGAFRSFPGSSTNVEIVVLAREIGPGNINSFDNRTRWPHLELID